MFLRVGGWYPNAHYEVKVTVFSFLRLPFIIPKESFLFIFGHKVEMLDISCFIAVFFLIVLLSEPEVCCYFVLVIIGILKFKPCQGYVKVLSHVKNWKKKLGYIWKYISKPNKSTYIWICYKILHLNVLLVLKKATEKSNLKKLR